MEWYNNVLSHPCFNPVSAHLSPITSTLYLYLKILVYMYAIGEINEFYNFEIKRHTFDEIRYSIRFIKTGFLMILNQYLWMFMEWMEKNSSSLL